LWFGAKSLIETLGSVVCATFCEPNPDLVSPLLKGVRQRLPLVVLVLVEGVLAAAPGNSSGERMVRHALTVALCGAATYFELRLHRQREGYDGLAACAGGLFEFVE
jgi:hypothetical protein